MKYKKGNKNPFYNKKHLEEYNPLGWKVIFISENEVDVDDWKELCLNKIVR